MIKQLTKSDILVSPFVVVKQWGLSNIEPQDLVLLESTSSDDSLCDTVALEFIDYTQGTPFVNTTCSIALEQQSTDLAIPESGVSGSGHFFPDSEPININTNTFKRLVYDQIQKSFYNDYRNPLEIFGTDFIDFPLNRTDRIIANEFLMFTIPRNVFGERVLENTVQLYDENFNDNVNITDDGNGNIIAGNNLFSKVQEVREFGNLIASGSASFTCPGIPTSSGECFNNTDWLTSSYAVQGYFDGMIDNTTGTDLTGFPSQSWDGTLTFYNTQNGYEWTGFDQTIIFPTHSAMTGREICNVYLDFTCSAGVPAFKFNVRDDTGAIIFEATKSGSFTPVGTYTNDNIGYDASPATIVIITNATTPASSILQDTCIPV